MAEAYASSQRARQLICARIRQGNKETFDAQSNVRHHSVQGYKNSNAGHGWGIPEMRLRDVVRGEKSNIQMGSWKAGPMPKSAFPLTKSGNKTLRFRSGYQWCIVTFSALSCDFKLLVAVNMAKEQYYAHLGMVCGEDIRMLGSYEYHGTHGSWHLHAGCDDLALIPVGRYEGPWRKMLPRSHDECRREPFGIPDLERALYVACKAFNVWPTTDDSGQIIWT